MGKIKSAISGFGGLVPNVRYAVSGFEKAPLLNTGFLVTIAALCMSASSWVVCLVLAVNNMQIANKSVMSSDVGVNFLSAGALYAGSGVMPIFVLLLFIALMLLVAYKLKEPIRKEGRSAKYEFKVWLISTVFSLVVAPAILLFAENILAIITLAIIAIVLFVVLSVAAHGEDGENSEGSTAGAMTARSTAVSSTERADAKKSSARIHRVDSSTKVFRGETIPSGKGIFGYAGFPNNAFYICSQDDYDKGRVRIVDRNKGDRDHSPILSGPPQGVKPAVSNWR